MNAIKFLNRIDREGKVCPMPYKWHILWEMLPDKKRVECGWEPAPPLILSAWGYTTAEEKRERFRMHVLYAEEKGVLEKVIKFLDSLSDKDWYYHY